jgi:hypothetical protein
LRIPNFNHAPPRPGGAVIWTSTGSVVRAAPMAM